MSGQEARSAAQGRQWVAPVFVLTAVPFGFAVRWLFGSSGLVLALAMIGVALAGAFVVVWSHRAPVTDVEVAPLWGHSTLCALNATGHRGPCTCGADRGRSSAATVTPRDVRVTCPQSQTTYTIRVTTRTFICPGCGKVGHASNT